MTSTNGRTRPAAALLVGLAIAALLMIVGGSLGAFAQIWQLSVIALVGAVAIGIIASRLLRSTSSTIGSLSKTRAIIVQPVLLFTTAIGLMVGFRSQLDGVLRLVGLLLAGLALALNAAVLVAAFRRSTNDNV